MTARDALIRYATTTRTVTVDGLDPLLDAAIAEGAAVSAAVPPAADRAAVLREAADVVEGEQLGIHPEQDAVRLEMAEWLRRMADETPQPETEAHPPHHRWYVETLDDVADEWAPGMRFTNRAEAVERYQGVSASHATWRDGKPVQRRFVRESTSYTVEAVEPQPAKEA